VRAIVSPGAAREKVAPREAAVDRVQVEEWHWGAPEREEVAGGQGRQDAGADEPVTGLYV